MAYYWEGTLVRLRPIEPEDWEAHERWDKDSHAQGLLDRVHLPRSRAGYRRWAEEQATKEPDGDNAHFEVETLAGVLVGSVAAHDCDKRVGTFELGVFTLAEHRRRGFAREAIALVLRYYFHELRYQKASAGVLDNNLPSQRLVESLGFQLEGRIRRSAYLNGQFHDYFAYGLTVEEFDAAGLIPPFGSA